MKLRCLVCGEVLLAGALGMALVPCTASAQSLPLGGRTASMGGAGTASGRDGAMPLVNPAGFGAVPSTTISLSASLYRYERLQIDDFFYSGRIDPALGELVGEPDISRNELSSSEFSAFPGAASVLWHFGPDTDEGTHHVLNVSAIVSRSANVALAGDFAMTFETGSTMQERLTKLSETTVYHFGPGYAMRSGALRLGAQLAFSYVDGAESSASTTRFFQPDGFASTEVSTFREFYSLAFQPVLGAQLNFPSGLGLGLSFSPAGIPVVGGMTFQSQSQTITPLNVRGTQLNAVRAEGEFDRTLPMTIRGGIAFEKKHDWGAAVDAVVRMPNGKALSLRTSGLQATQEQGFPTDVDPLSDSATFSERGAVAFYAGGETFVSELVALRGGLFYEPSVVELQQDAANVLALQQDAIGLSAGVGVENDLGEVTFGTTLSYASGKTVAADVFSDVGESEFPLVDANTFAAILFISGAVDVGELSNWMKAARDPAVLFNLETKTITVAELDPLLQVLVASPGYSSLEPQSATFIVTKTQAYDGFFERTARIRLTVEFSTALLSTMAKELRELSQQPGWTERSRLLLFRHVYAGGTDQLPSELAAAPRAADAARLLRAARACERLVRSLSVDIAGLPTAGEALVQRAQNDFKGPGVMVLPAALRGLGRAQSDLAISAQRLPALADALGDVFSIFTGRLTANPKDLSPVLQSRNLRLHELSPELQIYEGTGGDVVSQVPQEYAVTGIAELDAAFLAAAASLATEKQLRHAHGYVQDLLERVVPRWRARGLNPTASFARVQQEATQGLSKSTVPESQELLDGLRLVSLTLAAAKARLEQAEALRFDLSRLSASLDWAAGDVDVTHLRQAIVQADGQVERALVLLPLAVTEANQFALEGDQ